MLHVNLTNEKLSIHCKMFCKSGPSPLTGILIGLSVYPAHTDRLTTLLRPAVRRVCTMHAMRPNK